MVGISAGMNPHHTEHIYEMCMGSRKTVMIMNMLKLRTELEGPLYDLKSKSAYSKLEYLWR